MEESDPFEHLEWDVISKDDLMEHIADLMRDITWYNNCFYPPDITLAQAMEMRIMGQDAGLEAAIDLCPRTSRFDTWKAYYLFICICHGGNFQLDI